FLSRPTHEILELLESEQIDIGVATTADIDSSGITETPLLRDPFVLVLPATVTFTPNSPLDFMALSDTLPFLRYSSRQLIGRRVEAQLRRIGARFDRRMEFETSHVILSLVAAARGWTVTTALSFARAQRYHSSLRVMPFPGSAFSRDISVYTREDVPEVIATMSADTMRAAIRHMVIDPTCGRYPWLSETFRILSYTASDPESGGANASANSRIVPKESENAP
ncbi:MAG: LysR family transcriptional regulator substrate-binding protein, partial [Pseudomonadota bacterium]